MPPATPKFVYGFVTLQKVGSVQEINPNVKKYF